MAGVINPIEKKMFDLDWDINVYNEALEKLKEPEKLRIRIETKKNTILSMEENPFLREAVRITLLARIQEMENQLQELKKQQSND